MVTHSAFQFRDILDRSRLGSFHFLLICRILLLGPGHQEVVVDLLSRIRRAHRRHLLSVEAHLGLQVRLGLQAHLGLQEVVLDVPWRCQSLGEGTDRPPIVAALLEEVEAALDVPWQCQSDPLEECPCRLILPVYEVHPADSRCTDHLDFRA